MTMECSKSFNQCNYNESFDSLMFLDPDGGSAIARLDTVKYSSFVKMYDKMLSLFWLPEEIELDQDKKEFEQLSDGQQRIFTETLLRAVLLDSIQQRSINMMLLPIVSLPELEAVIETWSMFEGIHSKSYSHIIRRIYPNPDEVFNELPRIQGIIDCANDISKYYDDLYKQNVLRDAYSMGIDVDYNEYEHKKSLWLALNAVNGLEALRFYVSFATFFNFAENDSMLGNANILQLIARDENVHVGIVTQILQYLPSEDEDYKKIKVECVDEVAKIFNDIIEQELDWIKFVFRDETMLGLNIEILSDYVKYLGKQRVRIFGIPDEKIDFVAPRSNPLPWMDNWLRTDKLQVAPQESENINYTTGGIDMTDIDSLDIQL